MKESRIEKIALALTAVFSVFLSGVVLVCIVWLLFLLSSTILVRPAFAQSSTAAVQLEAGIAKEEVDGNLKSAIEVYQKIAADSSAPRDVRAKALLRLAGCYEKLGRQARQLYEQIVRDYSDQPAASQARTRLASIKQQEHPAVPPTMTVRKIEWSALGNIGPDDTDGERAIYGDFDGSIVFGDLAGHTKRLIYKHKDSDGDIQFRRSRDFSMVSLGFPATSNRPITLAVVKADGTEYRELVRDDVQGTILGSNWGRNWSWDDHYLVVWSNLPKGGGHLFLVSVADGHRRELLSIDTGVIGKAVFSPDGRYVAYCIQPEPKRFGTFRFFVVPAQGGQSRLVHETTVQFVAMNGSLLDWTADGRNLALVDVSRGQRTALFLLPIKDGTGAGPPTFVRDGGFEEGFTTSTGSLVYRDHASVPNGGNEFFIASFEPNGHLEKWQPLDLQPGNSPGWNPWPSFSPDGREIAYVTHGYGLDNDKLVLRNVTTGREHVLYQSTTPMICHYARQTPKIFCNEVQPGGQVAITSVAVDAGAVERVGSFSGWGWILQTSADGQTVYELKEGTPSPQLISLDLATRQETKLEDGLAIVVAAEPPVVARSSDQGLMIRPISGGAWKTLVRLKQDTINIVGTPDGTSLLYEDTDSMGRNSLFRIPLAGGQPERVGDLPGNNTGGLHINPDGRQLIAVNFRWDKYDLWILENFASSAKQSGGAR
jgi:Tol biopolymer transport system component